MYCVQMCTVLLPPGVNPNEVDKYIINNLVIRRETTQFYSAKFRKPNPKLPICRQSLFVPLASKEFLVVLQ